MKRLLIVLLIALVSLTACHVEQDPWPKIDSLSAPTATSVPTTAAPATATPTSTPTSTPAPGING